MTLENYTNTLLRYRGWVVALFVLITLACAAGVVKFTFSSDYQAFFGDDNPELEAFEATQNIYSRNDNILIMLEPANGDVFTESTLQAILQLTEQAWKLPYVTRVDSISNFQRSYGLEDELVIEDLYSTTDGDLSDIRENALAEPLLRNRLISENGQYTAVNITFNPPGINALKETPEVVNATAMLIAELQAAYPDIKFYETGVVLLNYALADLTIDDLTTLVPLVYILVAVGTAFFLRSAWLSVAAVVLVTMSIGIAMGLAGWAGIVLTPPSASVPPIIMTLAVADCLHFMSTLQQKRSGGADLYASIVESVKANFSPILLTSVSTAIGFLTLNFSDAPPFRDLGNITAIGVLAAFVLSVTFLPAFLTYLPLKPAPVSERLAPRLRVFADKVIAWRKPLLVFGLACVAIAMVLLPNNELNDNFVEYIGESKKFRTDTDHMTDKLIGLYTIEYSLDSGKSNGITEPEFLNKAEEFSRWLESLDNVVHVEGITDIIKRLHLNLHQDDPEYYGIPDSSAAVAQYLLLYEMSLPNGLDLNSQLNIDKSSTRITVSLKTMSTNQLLDFEKKATAWFEANAPEINAVGVSPSVMFSHISVRNIKGMLLGTAVALLLISVSLMLPLRSWRHGLLSMVSNIAPAVIAFGIWSLFVGKVSLGVSIVIAMTLGIVVDDTIHLLSKYLRAKRELGLDAKDAIRHTFATVGVALVGTTVILTLGFLVMGFSAYQVNSHMGILSAITISIALLIDFLLIPPLLLWIDSDKKHGTS